MLNLVQVIPKWIIVLLIFMINSTVFGQTTIYSENFNAGIGGWTSVDESDPTDQWTATAGYMEMNGFGGSNDIDWLISPAINLDAQGNEFFLFDYNDRFSGALIELYYSTNYSGTGNLADVTSATWNPIPLKLIDINATSCFSSLFQRHPAIDISAITGTSVYFAFRYTGLSSASKRYRIDDVHIEADYFSVIPGGISCAPLKTALHDLIVNHEVIRYTSSLYDVWDAILHTDTRTNDAGSAIIVWDMFTDIPNATGEFEFDHCANRDAGACPGGEGICYNREHTFPRSWWGGGTTLADTQNTDMHHVYASDRKLNGSKSNYPPGVVVTATTTGTNGFKVGTNPSYPCTGTRYFEPIDEFKGDYARTFFYFATRYEHNMAAWETINARGDCAMNGTSYPSYEPWLMTLLLQWHAADPVSQKEIDHNNAVFAIQGNRNPYIDSPNWVYLVWGDEFGTPCSTIVLPAELVDLEAIPQQNSVEIKWTTASEENSDNFIVERSLDTKNWEEIGQINAAGFSNELIDYELIDRNPKVGTLFYRLKQLDVDGEMNISHVVSAEFDGKSGLKLFPNPAEDYLMVHGKIAVSDIRIIDLRGRDLTQLVHFTRQNENTIRIDLTALEPNMYIVQADIWQEMVVKR